MGLPSNIAPEIVENFMRFIRQEKRPEALLPKEKWNSIQLLEIGKNPEKTLQIRTRVTGFSHETDVEGLFSKNGLQRILLSSH
ncbi:MAG: hypothetical protein Ct9H300mP23_07160 [Nitrospinota bacterium]|nr:MAG: hypothetical protein Ct9H300mP23_07160 [Nitrospinota bacterium]